MPIIRADELRALATNLLTAGGFGTEQAMLTADLLVWANLRGVDSHGVLRIPRYVEMVAQGTIVGDAKPSITRQTGAIALLDGGRSAGAVGMTAAADLAVQLAQVHGIGWCAVRDISHCGAIGYYTTAIAARGLIGVGMSASKPLMGYPGAKGEVLSTNPLAIAIPSRAGAPLVLDMSTAAVALGKIMAAKDAGRAIPDNWGVDSDGRATTDPAAVATLLPMAGAKGSGLSLMIEMLTSVLPGNPVIAPVIAGRRTEGFNGTMAALDPAAFGEPDEFAAAVAELECAIHQLPRAKEDEAILLPGERGAAEQERRDADGIPIAIGTARKLASLAQELEIADVPPSLMVAD